jgi:hypothetical protein
VRNIGQAGDTVDKNLLRIASRLKHIPSGWNQLDGMCPVT